MTGRARADRTAGTRPLRVALYGEFGTENLGNDGSLRAAVALLRPRLPGAELTAVCVHPDVVRTEHGIHAVAMHPPGPREGLPRLLVRVLRVLLMLADPLWSWRVLKGYDALVVCGTGIVEDSTAMKPWHAPWSLFSVALGARARGATVAFLDVGASPATTRAKRLLFGSALRLAAYRSYRDRYSLDAARSMGAADPDSAIHPDVCFSLPAPRPAADHDRVAPAASTAHGGAARTVEVGVGVMSWHGEDPDPQARSLAHRAYVAAVVAFTEAQVRAGRGVRMLIGESTDLPVARAVAQDVEGRCALAAGTIRVRPVRDLDGLMAEMRDVDALVATRFHNVVCALIVGKPLVSINYAPKNRELMRAVGLESSSTDVTDVTAAFLTEALDRSLAQREAIGEQIASRTAGYAQQLAHQVDDLTARLRRRAAPRTSRSSR